jgi:Family of unknown function (DUF5681)
MTFKKGQSGNPAGKKPGTPNKTTTALREQTLESLDCPGAADRSAGAQIDPDHPVPQRLTIHAANPSRLFPQGATDPVSSSIGGQPHPSPAQSAAHYGIYSECVPRPSAN